MNPLAWKPAAWLACGFCLGVGVTLLLMMEKFLQFLAVILPVACFVFLGVLLVKANFQNIDWKLAACFSGTAIAASLLVLLGTNKIQYLKAGDMVVEVKKEADDVKRLTSENRLLAKQVEDLTEQNKRLAVETVKSFTSLSFIAPAGYDNAKLIGSLENLLKATGASDEVIYGLLGTNSAKPK